LGNNIVDRLSEVGHTCLMETPDSLRDAIVYFDDFEHCREFMMALRWPDGQVKCPRCGSDRILWIPKARVWKCYEKHDHAKFSLKTGTIFEDSPIALEKWLPAAWLVINCKNGISSYELHRDLKVTQKTAWFMLHRIRLAMQSGTFTKLGGEVEVDETFIGGKSRNMHKSVRARKITGTGGKDKVAVTGMMERGGEVRTMVVDSRRKRELQSKVREHIEAGSAIFSDELKSYEGLDKEFKHAVMNHAVEYVNGNVHTNGMENFWSLLKRALHGTYVSVEPYHFFRYLDEQSFRFNNRKATDAERFILAMKQIVGKRLTYDQLTGKENAQSEARPSE
jgi:transposase-like protein